MLERSLSSRFAEGRGHYLVCESIADVCLSIVVTIPSSMRNKVLCAQDVVGMSPASASHARSEKVEIINGYCVLR